MQPTQRDARPRARSPFAAAFLSLLFPGLGHAYAGAFTRALASPPSRSSLIALGAGLLLRMDRIALLGLVLNPFILSSVFVVNLIALVYRIVAVVDAYRVTEFLNAHDAGGDGRLGPGRLGRNPLSIAGLLAVLLVMAGTHVAVARYDVIAMDVLDSPCIFVGDDTDAVCSEDTDSPDASADPTNTDTDAPGDSASADATPTPTPVPTAVGSALPQVSIPPWDGKQRLNILLIGADQRPKQGFYNTDTLIVVSIDPVSKQVAHVQPAARHRRRADPARAGAERLRLRLPGQDQQLVLDGPQPLRPVPGYARPRAATTASRPLLGELYGLDIKYFVEVNFQGFMKVVDALGGVTVNVQVPVSDDRYPGIAGQLERVYIPSGIQHMDGLQALRYARSRHSSNDFDRGQRQQRAAPLAARAGRPAGPDPAPDGPRQGPQVRRPDRHPGQPARRAARARLDGRHQGHPLVRVRAAVLPDGVRQQLARLHHRAERPEDPRRGQERLQDQTPRTRPSARSSRARAPTCGSSAA